MNVSKRKKIICGLRAFRGYLFNDVDIDSLEKSIGNTSWKRKVSMAMKKMKQIVKNKEL